MTETLERLASGRGTYGGDVSVPGQLWLAVVRSQSAHGVIRGVHVDAARKAPGVVAVLTASDLPSVPHIPIRRGERPGMTPLRQPVIAYDRVRYVGEPVAVVVATSPHAAEDGAELVEVDIDELPAMVVAATPPSHPLHDGTSDLLCHAVHLEGDFDRMAASAAVVVRERLTTGRHTGMPMETRSVLARWDEAGTSLEVWGPTKFVHFTRRVLAEVFDVPAEQVVCRRVDVGGMFGPRGEFYPEDFLVPWAARVTGRPVKWIEDRREHLLTAHQSPEHTHDVELAVAADGTFLGLRDSILVDMGAYARPIGGRVPELALEALPGPYRWGALDVEVTGRLTNKTPSGTVRGPSALEANFVRERVIDMAAARLGLDPVEIRRRNLIQGDELPFVRAGGHEGEDTIYDSGDFPALFEDLLAKVDFPAMQADAARRREDGELVGCGVGLYIEPSGVGANESLTVRLDDGRFTVSTSLSDVGQGLDDLAVRVAAEALGVGTDRVSTDSGSTSAHDTGSGTFGSRGTVFVGSATRNACEHLVAEARTLAAEKWGVDAADVHVDDAGLRCDDESLTWEQLGPMDARGTHDSAAPTYGFGVHLTEVAVDEITGNVRVERLIVGYDCGRIIDPGGVEGQLVGAAIQGLGATLLENISYDANGQPQVTSFVDYLLPTATDFPAVEAHAYEIAPAPGNPLGAKGAGEAGIAAVAAAVANAVGAACGSPGHGVTALPISPERVVDVLRRGAPADGRREVPAAPGASAAAPPLTAAVGRVHAVRVVTAVLAAAGVVAGVVRLAQRRRSRH